MGKVLVNIFLCAVLAVSLCARVSAQNLQHCPEIKYTDFFYLDTLKPDWSDDEVRKLLALPSISSDTNKFFIPVIVYQLAPYHSLCGKEKDERVKDLIALYYKIRPKPTRPVTDGGLDRAIEEITQDYYSLAEDPKTLPSLSYTMDDGPLYGLPVENSKNVRVVSSIKTDFGRVEVGKANGKMFLSAFDGEGKTRWKRLMTGVAPAQNLRSLKFSDIPVEKTSLATIIHLESEGEVLRVYLKNDGAFMFYYHSW